MKGFGGFVGLKETFLRRNKKESEVKFTFDLVNAEQIISILTGIDMKIEGNFSEKSHLLLCEKTELCRRFFEVCGSGKWISKFEIIGRNFPIS